MYRYRVRYRKVGTIRFVSHRDTMRVFQRGFVAAGLPLCYSQGYNPHPKLSFGPSLRTGWEGLDEYMDVFMERPVDDLPGRCNRVLPDGLRVTEAARVDRSLRKLSTDIRAARYEGSVADIDLDEESNATWGRYARSRGVSGGSLEPDRRCALLEEGIRQRFLAPSPNRQETEMEGDSCPSLVDVKVSPSASGLTVEHLTTMDNGRGLAPEDVLEAFVGKSSELEVPILVVRKALYIERAGTYCSPIDRRVYDRDLQ